MLNKDDLQRIHEEREVLEKWRKVSRHVVADLLEACSVCGTVREREHLARCPWCEDVYLCPKGCAYTHNTHLHPKAAFWI
jgi:hypothetical protein